MEAVRTVTTRHNVRANLTLDPDSYIDPTTDLDTEVLYAGGGNFVALFREEKPARAFTRALSRKALTHAPNLQLAVVHHAFEWQEPLANVFHDAFHKLTLEKRARALSAPLLGLGVSVMCQSTGLPAQDIVWPVRTDPTSMYPASAEIIAKVDASDDANDGLRTTFAKALGN